MHQIALIKNDDIILEGLNDIERACNEFFQGKDILIERKKSTRNDIFTFTKGTRVVNLYLGWSTGKQFIIRTSDNEVALTSGEAVYMINPMRLHVSVYNKGLGYLVAFFILKVFFKDPGPMVFPSTFVNFGISVTCKDIEQQFFEPLKEYEETLKDFKELYYLKIKH